MLAGAGEEDEFIKCFDDIIGREREGSSRKRAEVSAGTWRV